MSDAYLFRYNIVSVLHQRNPGHRSSCLVHMSIHHQLLSPLHILGTVHTPNIPPLSLPLLSTRHPHMPRHPHTSDPPHLWVGMSTIIFGTLPFALAGHPGMVGCHPAPSSQPHPHLSTTEDGPLVEALGPGNPLPTSKSTLS